MVTRYSNLKRPIYPDSKHRDSYELGLEFQDFVNKKLTEELGFTFTNYQSARFQFGEGENRQGIEIKLDEPMSRTERLSIEIAEKSKAHNLNWVPSGIYRYDNTWLYIQGNYDIFFIFPKNILIALHKKNFYQEHEEPTVKAFFIPKDDAFKYAAKFITCAGGNNARHP